MNFFMMGKEKGDLLIQVTVYTKGVIRLEPHLYYMFTDVRPCLYTTTKDTSHSELVQFWLFLAAFRTLLMLLFPIKKLKKHLYLRHII